MYVGYLHTSASTPIEAWASRGYHHLHFWNTNTIFLLPAALARTFRGTRT